MKGHNDTIAAIVTPPGKGGVGIVRASGADVEKIACAILGELPPARRAHFTEFKRIDGSVIDHGLAIYFVAPNSFTGENVLELQGHGGPVVCQQVLNAVCASGARLAQPGEFTERAFHHGKLDLAQAEAVADLIEASSEQAATSAMQSLQGAFSEEVNLLRRQLIELQMFVEAAIDFPDEDIEFIQSNQVVERLTHIQQQCQKTVYAAQQGVILRDGMTVVIAGRPNAGKSSLLNALSGRNSAIVTDIAGTTRDVLREYIEIDGMPLHVVDTAGLRETTDKVEQEGVKRARAELEKADVVLLIVDASDSNPDKIDELCSETMSLLSKRVPVLWVMNKMDLVPEPKSMQEDTLMISAKTGAGLVMLRDRLKEVAGYRAGEGRFMARARHLQALTEAERAIDEGLEQLRLHQASELLAEDIRMAHQALGKITGEFSNDDLLGEIFSSFCIGK